MARKGRAPGAEGDDRTFHKCRAFFPSAPDVRVKLQRALHTQIVLKASEHMRGTMSFPF